MKKYRFVVEVQIPDCDFWNDAANDCKEFIQDQLDLLTDDEGRWKVSVKETTKEEEE